MYKLKQHAKCGRAQLSVKINNFTAESIPVSLKRRLLNNETLEGLGVLAIYLTAEVYIWHCLSPLMDAPDPNATEYVKALFALATGVLSVSAWKAVFDVVLDHRKVEAHNKIERDALIPAIEKQQAGA
jgi:hypothetical protein